MITLYGFGPAVGLPDLSPFVMKAQILLRMSGLPFQLKRGNSRKAPKGKLPFIDDDGTRVADSTFIRQHLERRHGIDFSGGYGERDLAVGWAVEKMLEEHLYFLMVHSRWIDDANFAAGPQKFFATLPPLVRGFIEKQVRKKLRAILHGQGAGRYTEEERTALGCRDIDAVAAILGDKPFLLGDRPCWADATLLAFVSQGLCTAFESGVRRHLETKANLVAYHARLTAQYYN
ncbi:MAG: glutathione S-transferase family protein [Telluria sp.]